jgi:undecaprenyl-diphosphatase
MGRRRSLDASRERFFARPRDALSLGAALLVVVGLVAVLIPTGPLAIDQRWADAMRAIQTPGLRSLAHIFDALGRGLGLALSLTLFALMLVIARRWFALLVSSIAEGLAALGSSVLKALIGRERPPDGTVHTVTSSFPSGHTTYAATTCVALVLVFTAPGPRRRWWWALATLGIAGMAWSRTYLDVHWLSDVVAGALLGIGVALVVFGLSQLSRFAVPWSSRRSRSGRRPPPP